MSKQLIRILSMLLTLCLLFGAMGGLSMTGCAMQTTCDRSQDGTQRRLSEPSPNVNAPTCDVKEAALSAPSTASSVPSTASSVPSTASSVPSTASSVPTTTSSVPTTASSVPTTASSVPTTASSAPTTASSVPTTASSTPTTASSAPPLAASRLTLPDDARPRDTTLSQVQEALYGVETQGGSIDYLQEIARKNGLTVSTTGGEWTALCLARALGEGAMPSDIKNAYLSEVTRLVTKENGVLHSKKYSEYSRVILAWTALGLDAKNVGGYDFIAKLSDFYWTNWQGVNGTTFALIAADTHGYDFLTAEACQTLGMTLKDGATTRERLIAHLLDLEITNGSGVRGGWALDGKTPNADITGMAIQALAPYCQNDSKAKDAVQRALAVLRTQQLDSGGFASYGTANLESCAQVMMALCALGLDPLEADNGFVRHDGSILDAILAFRVKDGNGAFSHTQGGVANGMATDQATYALVAYERFLAGEKFLYDMSDVVLERPDQPDEMVTAELRLNGILLAPGAAIDASSFVTGENILAFSMSNGQSQTYRFDYTAPTVAVMHIAAVNNTAYLTCESEVLPSDSILTHEQAKKGGKDFKKFTAAVAAYEAIEGTVTSVGRLRVTSDKVTQEPRGAVTIALPMPPKYGSLLPMIASQDGGELTFYETKIKEGFATAKVNTLDEMYAMILMTPDSIAEVGNTTDQTDYDALIRRIEQADEGGSIALKINSKTEVPWEVFDALRDAKPNVSLRFQSVYNHSHWTFNSDSMLEVMPDTRYFDPWVILSETDGDAQKKFPDQAFLSVRFRSQEKLPGRSTLMFTRPEALQKAAAVTLQNLLSDGTLQDANERFAFDDGWNAITVTHATQYIMTAAHAQMPGTLVTEQTGSSPGAQPAAKPSAQTPMLAQLLPDDAMTPLQDELTVEESNAAMQQTTVSQEALATYETHRQDIEQFLLTATQNQQQLSEALAALQTRYHSDLQKTAGQTAMGCAGLVCVLFALTTLVIRYRTGKERDK